MVKIVAKVSGDIVLTRFFESFSMVRQHSIADAVTKTAGPATTQSEMIKAEEDQPGLYTFTVHCTHGMLVNHLTKKNIYTIHHG